MKNYRTPFLLALGWQCPAGRRPCCFLVVFASRRDGPIRPVRREAASDHRDEEAGN